MQDPFKADIRDVVALPEWQQLRAQLVGTWKHTPAASCARVAQFLGDGTDARRVRIALNYLTGSAFRMGIIAHPDVDKLLSRVRDHATRHRRI